MKTTTLLYSKNLLTGNVFIQCIFFWIAYYIATAIPLASFFPKDWRTLVFGIFVTLSVLAITYYFLKREGKHLTDVGLTWTSTTAVKFLGGVLAGSILFLFMLFCLVTFSNLTITYHAAGIDWLNLLWSTLTFSFLALMEELAFRAYPFVRLKSAYGIRTAFFTTAVAFALFHVFSGQNVIGSFLGPGIFAFVFGLAALWSGGIALATGLHLAINLMQGFFGMKGYTQHIWKLVPEQSPEGAVFASPDMVGLILQVVILVLSIVLMEWTIRKKRILPE